MCRVIMIVPIWYDVDVGLMNYYKKERYPKVDVHDMIW